MEAIGVLVSMINHCGYGIEHHFAGMARLLNDEARSQAIHDALSRREWGALFDTKQSAALGYSAKLTEHPAGVDAADIRALRDAGWSDGQILEINQLTAYFAYANRTVLGLGIDTLGDKSANFRGKLCDEDKEFNGDIHPSLRVSNQVRRIGSFGAQWSDGRILPKPVAEFRWVLRGGSETRGMVPQGSPPPARTPQSLRKRQIDRLWMPTAVPVGAVQPAKRVDSDGPEWF